MGGICRAPRHPRPVRCPPFGRRASPLPRPPFGSPSSLLPSLRSRGVPASSVVRRRCRRWVSPGVSRLRAAGRFAPGRPSVAPSSSLPAARSPRGCSCRRAPTCSPLYGLGAATALPPSLRASDRAGRLRHCGIFPPSGSLPPVPSAVAIVGIAPARVPAIDGSTSMVAVAIVGIAPARVPAIDGSTCM